ncbi:MAG: hypothetical protein Q9216_004011 [Gyalolechia sp. 2 TL-2023]
MIASKPDLLAASVTFDILEEAFGQSSLGILIVRGLPPQFPDLRLRLLSYASYLANLPSHILGTFAIFASLHPLAYLTGWSHGKEALKNGSYDTFKGSFYVNCRLHHGFNRPEVIDDAYSEYPELTASNVWPPEALLPGFRECFEELCTLTIDTAALVARACDRYALAKIEGYEPGYLERIVRVSKTTKARLLHYFPTKAGVQADQSESAETSNTLDGDGLNDWCTTHIDHGCLTGLTAAVYIDESAHLPPIMDLPESKSSFPYLPFLPTPPDPESGLYIRSRTGTITKVTIPADCLAFQTGECLQLITGGKFQAVPHFVRAGRASVNGRQVARNTLAVFTQPGFDEIVDKSTVKTYAQFSREVAERFK